MTRATKVITAGGWNRFESFDSEFKDVMKSASFCPTVVIFCSQVVSDSPVGVDIISAQHFPIIDMVCVAEATVLCIERHIACCTESHLSPFYL